MTRDHLVDTLTDKLVALGTETESVQTVAYYLVGHLASLGLASDVQFEKLFDICDELELRPSSGEAERAHKDVLMREMRSVIAQSTPQV